MAMTLKSRTFILTHHWFQQAAVAGFVLLSSAAASAGVINTFPDPSLPTFGSYSPVGEISKDNPFISITPRHNFATYFGQTFVALPGLASTLTASVHGGIGTDGIDFKALLAETVNGIPTNVIAETDLLTFGPSLGTFGTPVTTVISLDFGPLIEIEFGGVDLVDGARYAWVLDTVVGADGVEGAGSISYRHPQQANVDGSSVVLVFDLDTGAPNQPWIDVEDIDLAFSLSFTDGGVSAPTHDIIRILPTNDVPEPATFALVGAALAGVAVTRRRKSATTS